MNTTFTPELNSKVNSQGKHSVMIRITKARNHARIDVGFSVLKSDFDMKLHRVLPTCKNYKKLNQQITDKIAEAKSLELHQPKEIKRKIETGAKNGTFFDYCDNYLQQFKNSGTLDAKRAVVAKLQSFSQNLNFEDITKEFLLKYIGFLKEVKMNNDNTTQKNIAAIKTIYDEAVDDMIFVPIGRNPFRKLHLPTHDSYRDRLNFIDIALIEDLDLAPSSVIYHVRNIFLLQYYTYGCRIADMLTMKWNNVKGEHFAYTTGKNKKILSPLITEKSERILKLYKKSEPKTNEYIFPFVKKYAWTDHRAYLKEIKNCTALINKYLKKIAKLSGINKNIHTHVSRHSFAENARIRTKDTFIVSKSLGHSKLATTEGYMSQGSIEEMDEMARLVYG
jgi:site-specific recombinase XerD